MSDDELASPFEAPTFTRIPNYILDRVMPGLSPGGWKLLSVILRATLGFEDRGTGERLSEDMLSYSQLLARSGFRHPRSIRRALTELLQQGIIRRRPSEVKRAGLLAAPFVYALNEQWLVPVDELRTTPPRPGCTATESAADDQTATQGEVVTATQGEVVTATQSEVVTAAQSEETKENLNATQEKRKETSFPLSPLSQAFIQCWPSIREDLRGQMTASTFAQYFWNAQPVRTGNGQIRLAVRSEWEADWIRLRLYRPLLASLRSFLGEELREDQVEIIALAAEQDHTDVVSRLTDRAVTGNPMEQPSGG